MKGLTLPIILIIIGGLMIYAGTNNQSPVALAKSILGGTNGK